MATPKTIVEPDKAVTQPPPAPEDAKPVKTAVFWKAFAPKQPIVFEDGSSVVFGQERFVTSDGKLIEKLKQCASKYGLLVETE